MNRSRGLVLGAGLLAASAFLFLTAGGPPALAKGKKEVHLRYIASYADAVREARSRNAILFATFHKDN